MIILQATYEPAADTFVAVQNLIDPLVEAIFAVVTEVFGYFYIPITLSAMIYIALLGYAMLSGYIVMSGREAAVRLSKVILVLVVLETFRGGAYDAYDLAWSIPDSLGGMFASVGGAAPSATADLTAFGGLIQTHTLNATAVAQQFINANAEPTMVTMTWIVSMAPMAVWLLVYAIAKIVSAALFIVAPVVLLLALFSVQTPFIMSWVKAFLVTIVTVFLLYFLGAVTFTLLQTAFVAMQGEIASNGSITMQIFYIYGVLALFGVLIISQASSIASSVIGAAAINTQQGTSLMQIGALNAAR